MNLKTQIKVSQNQLLTFMQCRAKLRHYLEGWVMEGSTMGLTYGSINHSILDHAYSNLKKPPTTVELKSYIAKAEEAWLKEHPLAKETDLQNMELSLALAEATMPAYFKYWKKDFTARNFKSLEEEFNLPLFFPEKNTEIILNGFIDGTFEYKKEPGLWILENKFYSRVDEGNLVDTLHFDFQVLFYAHAIFQKTGAWPKGVLYNVVRRSSFRQGKKETLVKFAQRCAKDVASRPEHYFFRFEIALDEQDYINFTNELTGLLLEFIDWYQGRAAHYKNTSQCITKYGRCPYILVCGEKDYIGLTKRQRK